MSEYDPYGYGPDPVSVLAKAPPVAASAPRSGGWPWASSAPPSGGWTWAGSNGLAPTTALGSPFATGPAADALVARNRSIAARQAGIDLSNPSGAPRQAVYNAQDEMRNAYTGVYNAENASYPLQRNVLGANRNVIGLQQGQSAMERALIQSEMQRNSARGAENTGIRAALADTSDQAAVGQAGAYRDNRDRFNARLGIDAPVQVKTPDNFSGVLPYGTEEGLQTHAQRLQAAQQRNEEDRQLASASQKLGVQLTGQDVQDAQLVAKALGIDVDEAQIKIEEAKTAHGQAVNDYRSATDQYGRLQDQSQYDTQNADLEEKRLATPPQAGQVEYMDPVSHVSRWVWPEEKAQLDYDQRTALDQSRYKPQDLAKQSTDYVAELLARGYINEQQARAALAAPHASRPYGLSDQQIEQALTLAKAAWEKRTRGGTTTTGEDAAVIH